MFVKVNKPQAEAAAEAATEAAAERKQQSILNPCRI